MDTICYLCRYRPQDQKERLTLCAVNEYFFPKYRLARIELEENFWEGTSGLENAGKGFFANRSARRQEKKKLRRVQEKLATELASILAEHGEHYCVCAGRLAPWVGLQDMIALPEFDGYLDQDWVERMLPYAGSPHFVILGNAPYLPDLLRTLARRMKSLVWVLPDHYYAEMLEDFAEDFYQEYGLAMELRFPGADETYGHVRIEKRQREPVNVLDFTENKCIPHIDLEDGSVWLDFAAVEGKEKKLIARGMHVVYMSLKKQWEQPQKAASLLDTVYKNRYNT